MNASHNRAFLDLLGAPAEAVQRVARQNFELLKRSPGTPLCISRKSEKLWSVRVGINHRALAVQDGADFIWVWIGPHDEYERLIKQQA